MVAPLAGRLVSPIGTKPVLAVNLLLQDLTAAAGDGVVQGVDGLPEAEPALAGAVLGDVGQPRSRQVGLRQLRRSRRRASFSCLSSRTCFDRLATAHGRGLAAMPRFGCEATGPRTRALPEAVRAPSR